MDNTCCGEKLWEFMQNTGMAIEILQGISADLSERLEDSTGDVIAFSINDAQQIVYLLNNSILRLHVEK